MNARAPAAIVAALLVTGCGGADATPSPTARTPRPPAGLRDVASLMNCDACSDGSPARLRRRDGGTLPASIPIYRNVHAGEARERNVNPYESVPTTIAGRVVTVNWRYITNGGGFVLVRASSRNAWLFGENDWAYIDRRYLPRTTGRGGLCDNTEGASPGPALPGRGEDPLIEFLDYDAEAATARRGRPPHVGWPAACSHSKYDVPDHDGPP
jgi:hypothetical protein